MENFGHTLGQIQKIAIMSTNAICSQPAICKSKLCHLIFVVYKISRDALNIWLVTLIKPYVNLLIIMMDQMSADLHGVVIKLKTTQNTIVYNATKMHIMLKF